MGLKAVIRIIREILFLLIISSIVPGSEMASTLLSTCSVFSSTDDSTVSTCDLSLLEEAVRGRFCGYMYIEVI